MGVTLASQGDADSVIADSRPRTPFFVVGTGRCGSTLFQAMLKRHPDIRIPIETHYFLHLDPAIYGVSSLDRPRDIELYFQRLRANSAHAGPAFDFDLIDELRERIRGGETSPRDHFLWFLNRTTQDQSGELVGEKTPAHWMKLDRIDSLFPDAKCIHVHRDPRAVTESLLRMKWWHSTSITWTAKYCKRTLNACDQWANRVGPDRFLQIAYQDLIADTQGQLEKTCDFLEIPYNPCMLDPDRDPSNWKPFSTLDPTRAELYRENLSRSHIATIETVVGTKTMAKYGYTPDSSAADRMKCLPWLAWDRIQSRLQKYGGEIRKLSPVRKHAK